MDTTLVPPRNQQDPFENQWDSLHFLHFQYPALMWNSARQRHPGGHSGNLMVIEKPLAAVTFYVPEMPAAGFNIWIKYLRWFLCDLSSAQCMRKAFKPIGNHNISKHPRRNAEHSKELGHRGGVLAKKDCGTGFVVGDSSKLIPRHAI